MPTDMSRFVLKLSAQLSGTVWVHNRFRFDAHSDACGIEGGNWERKTRNLHAHPGKRYASDSTSPSVDIALGPALVVISSTKAFGVVSPAVVVVGAVVVFTSAVQR